MKTSYKGHEITVTRERSMGGWTQIYYGVFRESDGYECTSGFCDTSDSTRTFTRILKDRVDAELADDDPWAERKRNGGAAPTPPGEGARTEAMGERE